MHEIDFSILDFFADRRDIGIVEKAAMAQKAMPLCNIVCITGEEMKQALSGYLEVLSGQDAKSIGGTLPGDDFYYLP